MNRREGGDRPGFVLSVDLDTAGLITSVRVIASAMKLAVSPRDGDGLVARPPLRMEQAVDSLRSQAIGCLYSDDASSFVPEAVAYGRRRSRRAPRMRPMVSLREPIGAARS